MRAPFGLTREDGRWPNHRSQHLSYKGAKNDSVHPAAIRVRNARQFSIPSFASRRRSAFDPSIGWKSVRPPRCRASFNVCTFVPNRPMRRPQTDFSRAPRACVWWPSWHHSMWPGQTDLAQTAGTAGHQMLAVAVAQSGAPNSALPAKLHSSEADDPSERPDSGE